MSIEGLVAVEKTKSYEAVVRQVLTLISRGELAPGQKLPPERQLASQLRIGRTTLREALRALEILGFIETAHGEGSFIRSENRLVVPNQIIDGLLKDSAQLRELYEVRALLEPQAAFLAAERRSPEQFGRLEQFVCAMEEALDRPRVFADEDIGFHFTIAEMAHNNFLCEFQRVVLRALRPSWLELLLVPGRSASALNEHKEVCEAIKTGRARAAKVAMERHLKAGEVLTLRRYRERLGEH